MKIGQRQTGSPVCSWGECTNPAPELEGLDLLAYALIRECYDQFEIAAGLGGAAKVKFDWANLERIARWHGIRITPPLYDRLKVFRDANYPNEEGEPAARSARDSEGYVEDVN